MKLIRKLFFIGLLLSVGIVIIFSITVYFLTSTSLERVISLHQQNLAVSILDRIDLLFADKSSEILRISKEKEIVELLKSTEEKNSLRKPGKDPVPPTALSALYSKDKLEIVDLLGQVIYSTEVDDKGTTILTQPTVKNNFYKIQTGENFQSEVFLDHKTGIPTIILAIPVRDYAANNQVVGGVISYLSWPELTNLLINKEAIDIELFDDKGTLLADSIPEKKNSRAVLQSALQGENGTIITSATSDEKESKLTTFVGRKIGTNNTFIVIAGTPVSQAFMGARSNAFTSTLISIPISLLLVFVIIFVLQRFIILRISSLTNAAREFASGNLDKRVEANSSDEVGQLASSFNEMADKLQELYFGLERKVAEKTAELNQKVKDIVNERSRDEAILQGVSDGLIVTDNSGTILLMNSIAAQILFLPHNMFKGKRIFEAFSLYETNGKPTIPQTWPYIKATLTGIKSTKDFLYVLPNGKKIELNITASPFLGGGKISGAITIIRDVTKEREVDRMKTEFISLASHQLRTPLSAIRWFTEMLLNGDAGKLNSEQEDFAKNVSDSTQRMIDLVNSLLNISRIESGRIVIDPKPTNLKELLDTAISEVNPKMLQKSQHISVVVNGDIPIINLDQKLIRQVYLNLLTNAIKYTSAGGQISVFISKKDNEIISQVTDNGFGIPKDQQSRIFERFFRASNIIKKETDGTGLGLYLIKAIVESSRGKLWFQSDENKGTTFYFSLPISGMVAKTGEVTLD